jgi:signal transduction histidine kinase
MSLDQAAPTDRVAEAQRRADARLRQQRDTLRPLGWALVAVVVASTATQQPAPGVTGTRLAVTVAVAVYVVATMAAVGDQFPHRSPSVQLAVVASMAAAGVVLSGLQPRGATDLAGGAAAWIAVTRLPLATGTAVAAAIGLGLAAVAARTGSIAGVLAVLLLTALLALVAYLMRESRESQTRTELLLAELADARDAQAEAAVAVERSRIAAELHDVLAHSLSGAALQLQGARLLAARGRAGSSLTEAIDRASQLVADGLVNARHAVAALRGTELPSLAQLDQLVEGFRRDLQLEIRLEVEGTARPLPPEVGLALYRGVEEALTNVARHANGAATRVRLTYQPDRTTVDVDNRHPPPGRELSGALGHLGGGNGLAGLRDRIEHAGGHLDAGPTENGWHVGLAVPL